MELVEVLWDDACSCSCGTHSLEEAKEHSVAKARTVGYVLDKDKKRVVLGMTNFYDTKLPQSETAEMGYRFIWIIPRKCITKIQVLESTPEAAPRKS